MTIWIGSIGITIHSDKESYLKNLKKRFFGFIDDKQGQIDLEIVETNFRPEVTKKGDGYFWFTMFSENIYVYIEYSNWKGKAFICEETSVKYDAIDSMLTMIAAQFSPMFCSILVHGCCIDYQGTGLCFIGDSGVGKSTLTKIFSSDYQIIAEDMFCLECHEGKVIAHSIPFGQKHLWVESGKKIIVKKICFVNIGNLHIVLENDQKKIFNTLLHNQFYKAITNDTAMMDAMRFNINRICKNVLFYNFIWEAEQFYKKNRKYIINVKDEVARLVQSPDNKIKSDSNSKGALLLNQHIHIRKDSKRNRLEIWDASVHRLYGVTGLGMVVLNYANQKKQFTFAELKDYIESQLSGEEDLLIEELNCLLEKDIICWSGS